MAVVRYPAKRGAHGLHWLVVSDIVLLHNRIRYIRSHHCDLKISQYSCWQGGKELPKKLRIFLCQKCTKMHYFCTKSPFFLGSGHSPSPDSTPSAPQMPRLRAVGLDAFGVSTLGYSPTNTIPYTRLCLRPHYVKNLIRWVGFMYTPTNSKRYSYSYEKTNSPR